ncbi:MAG: hypothetical protein J0J01_32300 [Reyranella sp.]|uniref:hypothetical protein n=1 Tax=Reyranella sp. TaxID=1929291 RepID=UPI001AC78CC1|nr:hypothetical protein [Reyranella sp.]MBN9091627.1 hypothetical protein [Reyranella sp.]
MTTDLASTDIQALHSIAGTMIPVDTEFGTPGADDPAILADIAKSIGRDLPLIRTALAEIDKRAGGTFASLDRERREALINDWYATGGAAAAALGRVVLAAYYRDDRVLRALGHEARAPFPQGHVVEQGDWSLLDPVKRRAAFWRDDRGR